MIGKFCLLEIYVLFCYLIKTKHTLQVWKWNFKTVLTDRVKNTTTHPSWLKRVIARLSFYLTMCKVKFVVPPLNLFLIWAIFQTTAPDLLPRLLISDLLEAEVEVVGRQTDSGGVEIVKITSWSLK